MWSVRTMQYLTALLLCAQWPLFVQTAEAVDSPSAPSALQLRNVRIVDVEKGVVLNHQALRIENGRIVDIRADQLLTTDAKTSAIDLHGQYLSPGLIDTHVHVATYPDPVIAKAQLSLYLYNGITSVRDMAGDARLLAELKRELLNKEIAGPDLFYSALMAGPAFFNDERVQASTQGEIAGAVPWMQALDEHSNMPLLVAQARGSYARGIKLYANIDPQTFRELVSEARRQHFSVWSHACVFPARPSEMILPGLASLSHAYMLGYETADSMLNSSYTQRPKIDFDALDANSPVLSSLLSQMRQNAVALDATLYVMKHAAGITQIPETVRAQYLPQFRFSIAITKAALQNGVTVTTGSDVYLGHEFGTPGLWSELDVWRKEAGISALETVRAATINGATVLGLADEIGSIRVGKRANLIVLPCDPLEDSACLQQASVTYKDGRQFDRTQFVMPQASWDALQN